MYCDAMAMGSNPTARLEQVEGCFTQIIMWALAFAALSIGLLLQVTLDCLEMREGYGGPHLDKCWAMRHNETTCGTCPTTMYVNERCVRMISIVSSVYQECGSLMFPRLAHKFLAPKSCGVPKERRYIQETLRQQPKSMWKSQP
jgi:hypothetical protein